MSGWRCANEDLKYVCIKNAMKTTSRVFGGVEVEEKGEIVRTKKTTQLSCTKDLWRNKSYMTLVYER